VVYRLAQLYWLPELLTEPPDHFIRSPLTLLILGTLLAYYARYAWGSSAGRAPWRRHPPLAS
jgi:hypothetical protein